MVYYIFRHGETFATKNNVQYAEKIISAPILPEGIETTKRLANYLKDIKTDYNVISNFLRVAQTAKIIADVTKKVFVVDERLHDTLVPPPGYEDKYPETETKEEFVDRVKSFLNDVLSKEYKNILIGTHGGVIAALKHLVTIGEFDYDRNLMDFPKPGVLTIIKDKKVEEINFNNNSQDSN